MAFFNYVTKEITLKVVYYGPGLSGKTTNLQHLYSALDPTARGKFISLATESDRTLFFDFLPVELGRIKDFSVRFQLYTVPGQIRYNATRKLVLKGADAVVFVADSQRDMREQNMESFMNMRENLVLNSLDPDGIPVVLQYNKRDLPNVLSIAELNKDLNKQGYQTIEAVAVDGRGVEETFRLVTKILLKDMVRKHKVEVTPATEEIISTVMPDKKAPVSRVAAETVSTEKPEEAIAADKGKIFPDVEEIVSVKIPDNAVFEMKEPEAPLKTGEARRENRLPEEKIFPQIKEQAKEKAEDEITIEDRSGAGAEDFQERTRVSEPFIPETRMWEPPRGEAALKPAVPLEPPRFHERPDPLATILPELKKSLKGIEESLSLFSSAVKEYTKESGKQQSAVDPELRETMKGIKESLSLLSSAVKESGRQQADMVKLLKDIRDRLNEADRKRRWFHFFSW